ncbi:MAG: hypothetical protein CM15mP42_08190 [Methanobacteriota archaeon]|nr:MAG: hypothetical protein CM15mP42_08190 [Euryarchaeota archaeon]
MPRQIITFMSRSNSDGSVNEVIDLLKESSLCVEEDGAFYLDGR